MSAHISCHSIASIKAEWVTHNGRGWIDFAFTDKRGDTFELTCHCIDGKPIPIEGADVLLLLALASQKAEPDSALMVVDGGTFVEAAA